jgi:hypothetical protein
MWGQSSVHDTEERCADGYAESLQDACLTLNDEYHSLFSVGVGTHRRSKPNSLFEESQCDTPQVSGEHSPQVSIRVINDLRIVFLNHLLPLPLTYNPDHDKIEDYPGIFDVKTRQAACPPGVNCSVPDPVASAEADVLEASHSVGRLVLEPQGNDGKFSGGRGASNYAGPYFWGSAFMIAQAKDLSYGVVATTCHELESLVEKHGDHWVLKDKTGLQVDFGAQSDEYPQHSRFKVSKLLAYGDDIDVAFLSIDKNQYVPFPDLLTLYHGNEDSIASKPRHQPHYLALVGYADLEHFADSVTERVYRVFEEDSDPDAPEVDKFATLDWIVSPKKHCIHDKYSLHIASTTVGASGSILMDLATSSVVAMHTCCSKYFPNPKAKSPESEFPCARLTRTFANQAVGAWSVFQDHDLCKALNDNNVQCPPRSK